MTLTKSKQTRATQSSAGKKPSRHFLKAAVGGVQAVPAGCEHHCADDLAFWVSGGYSVNKASGNGGPG